MSPDDDNKRLFLLPVVCLPLALLLLLATVYSPSGTVWEASWVPSLGVSLSFHLDGLSMLFAGLICGVGFLVQLYTLAYMAGKPTQTALHGYLTLFMAAMLGLVLAGNLLLMFVFWELTTLTSYLLIGFDHHREVSRRNALQAMLITGAGGLALLAGLILLGNMAGTWQIDQILPAAGKLRADPRFVPSMLLILLGAFTKSAQFPFHFWLPGAMAAPAPVSAYLHSATMVKAGVYLMARLLPVYGQHELWFWILAIAGGITAFWTGLVALRQTDLKLMLAYSTNVALGKLTLLLAVGTKTALAAALLFTLAHAMYKAALFMVVGTVDKAAGTRDIRRLSALGRVLPISMAAAVLAALSKAGIPPLAGFISKEYMYKAALDSLHPLAGGVLFTVNAVMVCLALTLVIRPFLGRPGQDSVPVKPKESVALFWVPPLVLALIGFFLPLVGLGWLDRVLVGPAGLAMSPEMEPITLKLWHGVNLPLLMSGATLAFGTIMYCCFSAVLDPVGRIMERLPSAPDLFQACLSGLGHLASWQTRILQPGQPSRYLLALFTGVTLLLVSGLPGLPGPAAVKVLDLRFYEPVLAAVLAVAVITTLLSRSRMLAVAALGVAGFVTTLLFMLYSAPDVAKTQLLVETLVVIFLVLVMRRLPRLTTVPGHGPVRRLVHAGIALAFGTGVAWLLFTISAGSLDPTLAEFFAENSLPGGHGRNIVNVILVDFRALDTLGEIVVVVAAAVASVALLGTKEKRG